MPIFIKSREGSNNVKAKEYNLIRTLVDVQSNFRDRILPAGTVGTVVECYDNPIEGYAVDLVIPDASLVGRFDYENAILFPEQFEVMDDN